MRLLLVLVMLMVAGCTSVTQMQDTLSKATLVTPSVAEMNFEPLQTGVEKTVVFGDKTPTYNFEFGKGYYLAATIPEPHHQPRLLSIKTYVTAEYLPSAGILIPTVQVLDEKKQLIAKIENYRLDEEVNFFSGAYFVASVPLPDAAVYLLLNAATTSEQRPSVYSENGTEYILPLAPAGRFALTLGEPLAKGYDFSKAIIKDSVLTLDTDKADFFYAESVNGNAVKNSLGRTVQLNRGKGFRMDTYLLDREVAANKPVTLNIVGATHYAAPIQELLHKVYEVKGQVTFTPLKNRKYVVTGELNETHSVVWVEDEETHDVMDKKVEFMSKAAK